MIRTSFVPAALVIGLALSASVAIAVQEPPAAAVKPAPVPGEGRTFTGTSDEGVVQEALDRALASAQKELAHDVADLRFRWRLDEVSGTRGGIAGTRSCSVTIRIVR